MDPRKLPRAWIASFSVLAASTLLVVPACKKVEPPPAEPATTQMTEVVTPPPFLSPAKQDVRLVEVTAPGTAEEHFDPASIKVKKKTQIIVWVLDVEGTLKVEFPADKNPFDSQPSCLGRFCVALKPPAQDKPAGHYPYTATVTTLAGTQTADPDVEVVD